METSESERSSIVAISGVGLVTPVGVTVAEVLTAIRQRRSGIAPVTVFNPAHLSTSYFAEVPPSGDDRRFPVSEAWKCDKGTRMAARASGDALRDAGFDARLASPARLALCVGVSGSGQLQHVPISLQGGCVESRRSALYHARNVPHFQTATLARLLGIQGPVLTFCNASAGGAAALVFALALVRAGRVDAALVGGGEALTLLSALAMDALKLTASRPCSPFGESGGMTFGEGAAFLVIERQGAPEKRGGRTIAELSGFGATSDAYDVIANDPSGRGLARAYREALTDAEVTPRDIAWVKASGTGNRAQDQAELLALRGSHAETGLPVVASYEPLVGHANGATPTIGVVFTSLCVQAGLVPASVIEPNAPPPAPVEGAVRPRSAIVASNTMGFGGSNAVFLLNPPGSARGRSIRPAERIVVTGLGVVSPIGTGTRAFAEGLHAGKSGICPVERFSVQGLRAGFAALVSDDLGVTGLGRGARRRERIGRFAVSAVSQALADANLVNDRLNEQQTALVVATSHGPVSAQQNLMETLGTGPFTAAHGRTLLDMSRFAMVSDLCATFRLRGPSSSVSGGITIGLAALVAAQDLLAANDRIEAVVVVAADEVGPLFYRLADHLGLLAPGHERLTFCPYAADGRGLVLGEGAAALVLEREGAARKRGQTMWGRLAGTALTADGLGFWTSDPAAPQFTRAIAAALEQARWNCSDVGMVYGHGRGLPVEDGRELRALAAAFNGGFPLSSLAGQLGVAEASCALMSVVAGLLGMQESRRFPLVAHGERPALSEQMSLEREPRSLTRTLIVGSTEDGMHAAVSLEPAAH